jgi:hypothetical protein
MRARISFLAAAFFMLTFLGCEKKEKASVDLKGYIMQQCGSNLPESNVKVTLGLGGVDLLTATTDAKGYFHIKGEYDVSVCSQCGDLKKYLAFVGNGGSGGFYQVDIAVNFPNNANLDTIYVKNSTYARVHVNADVWLASENDTLTIFYNVPQGSTIIQKLVGPLSDTVLFPVEVKTFSHIGYPSFDGSRSGLPFNPGGIVFEINNPNFRLTSLENYHQADFPFVLGQPNHACGRVYDVTIDLSE